MKFDGTFWTYQRVGNLSIPNLRGVQGSNDKNIWAVGDNGTILKYIGTS